MAPLQNSSELHKDKAQGPQQRIKPVHDYAATAENSHSIHGTPEDERGANFSLIAENRK